MNWKKYINVAWVSYLSIQVSVVIIGGIALYALFVATHDIPFDWSFHLQLLLFDMGLGLYITLIPTILYAALLPMTIYFVERCLPATPVASYIASTVLTAVFFAVSVGLIWWGDRVVTGKICLFLGSKLVIICTAFGSAIMAGWFGTYLARREIAKQDISHR